MDLIAQAFGYMFLFIVAVGLMGITCLLLWMWWVPAIYFYRGTMLSYRLGHKPFDDKFESKPFLKTRVFWLFITRPRYRPRYMMSLCGCSSIHMKGGVVVDFKPNIPVIYNPNKPEN